MTRRTGATLVEVLVTIFVMALGLMALLTLFPLGALSMAQAIKDSRSALAAANAEALASARNVRQDSQITGPFSNRPDFYTRPAATGTDSWYPSYGPPPPNSIYPLDALPDGPSYPILVDPIGWQAYTGSQFAQRWVGADRCGIARRSASTVINSYPNILRNYCLLDDITFGKEGVPIGPDGEPSRPLTPRPPLPPLPPNPVQREGKYSWAFLLRRPRTATVSVVDMTVVVYSQRPLQAINPLQPAGENAYNADHLWSTSNNVIRLTWSTGQEKPPVRKGSWILDVSRLERMAGPTFPATPLSALEQAYFKKYGPVNGYFYRVNSVRDVSANQMDLEVATDITKRAPISFDANGTKVNFGRVIVMENVVEVFEKGPGWLP